jgi:ABC-2 type transport system ATP-binding protein
MWEYLRRINEQGTTIILTTHYLEEAENLCRHVGIIDAGQIVENDRMSSVLRKLHQEVFILSLQDPLPDGITLDGFKYSQLNESEIEVEMLHGQNLNTLFVALTQAGLNVLSMRNKANRLEELFMRLVERREKDRSEQMANPEVSI